jgi:hypothetical protein
MIASHTKKFPEKQLIDVFWNILTDIDTTIFVIDNIFIDIDVIPCFNDYVASAKQVEPNKLARHRRFGVVCATGRFPGKST